MFPFTASNSPRNEKRYIFWKIPYVSGYTYGYTVGRPYSYCAVEYVCRTDLIFSF